MTSMGSPPITPQGRSRPGVKDTFMDTRNSKLLPGLSNEFKGKRRSVQKSSLRQTKGGGFGGFNYSMRSSNNSLMMKMNQ